MPPRGTWGILQLRLDGLDESIEAEVRIIRSSGSTAVAFFFFAPPELVRWIGLLSAVDIASHRSSRPVGRNPACGPHKHSQEQQEEF
jgi:hypothetical protein